MLGGELEKEWTQGRRRWQQEWKKGIESHHGSAASIAK